jgi:hypothetical protein
MDWNRSQTLALASYHCTRCHGAGSVNGRGSKDSPCNCVLRNIFRACYARFRECVEKDKQIPRVQLERGPGGGGRRYFWSRKEEEYIADFTLVSKRSLSEAEHQVFKFHFLMGADWRLCCRRLKMEKGNFFHMVYRIEQRLGKVFRELQPYALYPLDEYFHSSTRGAVKASKPEDAFDALFGEKAA